MTLELHAPTGRAGPILPPVRRALIFEGGGARGSFAAGVLGYLARHPQAFPADLVCGTSIGALSAAALAFGKVEELVALWGRLQAHHVYRRRSWRELAWEFLARRRFVNLYDVSPLRRLLEELFGDRQMADSPIELCLTAFSLQSGQPMVLDRTSPIRVVDAILASMAIQGIFPPQLYRGYQLIDGGNAFNLPLGPALAAGARDLMVVRASVPDDFTPGLYRDIVSIQKRAYSVMVSRATDSDLARAQELSEILSRAQRLHTALQGRLEALPASPERFELLELASELSELVPGKSELRLRVLEPPPGTSMPELLELKPFLSLRLMDLGSQSAARLFEEEEDRVL